MDEEEVLEMLNHVEARQFAVALAATQAMNVAGERYVVLKNVLALLQVFTEQGIQFAMENDHLRVEELDVEEDGGLFDRVDAIAEGMECPKEEEVQKSGCALGATYCALCGSELMFPGTDCVKSNCRGSLLTEPTALFCHRCGHVLADGHCVQTGCPCFDMFDYREETDC